MFQDDQKVNMLLVLGESRKIHAVIYPKVTSISNLKIFSSLKKKYKHATTMRERQSARVNADNIFGTVLQYFEKHPTQI